MNQLISLPIAQRAAWVKQQADLVDVPDNIDHDLSPAYQLAKALTTIFRDFIEYQRVKDSSTTSVLNYDQQSCAIASTCQIFSTRFIQSMPSLVRSPETMAANPRNLYELCGASLFTESNSISRSLSTRLGSLWEVIAKVSPYTVSPEKDFGIKIRGVDIILWHPVNQVPIFTQLKTMPGTLTGSQSPRSRKELEIHESSLFAAAFCLGSWNFSSPTTPRACGAEFWSIIGLDYNLLKHHVKAMILTIESEYINLKGKRE